MRYRIARSPIVVLAATAAFAGAAFAQNQNDRHQSDQPTSTQSSDQRPDERNQPARSANDTRRDTSRTTDERDTQNGHRVASADDNDMTARYRHDHPHAAARCHDGFFTQTTDRKLACSKHGGIDIWLQL